MCLLTVGVTERSTCNCSEPDINSYARTKSCVVHVSVVGSPFLHWVSLVTMCVYWLLDTFSKQWTRLDSAYKLQVLPQGSCPKHTVHYLCHWPVSCLHTNYLNHSITTSGESMPLLAFIRSSSLNCLTSGWQYSRQCCCLRNTQHTVFSLRL